MATEPASRSEALKLLLTKFEGAVAGACDDTATEQEREDDFNEGERLRDQIIAEFAAPRSERGDSVAVPKNCPPRVAAWLKDNYGVSSANPMWEMLIDVATNPKSKFAPQQGERN